jgi:hypothetical protein
MPSWVEDRLDDIEYLYKYARDGGGSAKPFRLDRNTDYSGVSGTGVVAEGVEFPNGKVLIKWLGDRPSLVLWQSMDDAVAIHGHNGGTEFVYE